jgi:hypothetical protein
MGNYVTEMESNCKKGFLFISWLFSISLSKYQKLWKICSREKLLFWGKNVTFWRKIAENGKLCHGDGNNCKKRYLFISWLFSISLSKYQRFRKIFLGESCYFEAKTSLLDEKSPKMGNYVTEMETNCKKRYLFISW